MTTQHLKKSIGRSSSRLALFLIPLVFACFVLSHAVRAVSPTPDGLYPGMNVAEGGPGALFSLTTGTNNTATGWRALFRNTTGERNTADGSGALLSNTDGTDNTATGAGALSDLTAGIGNTAVGSNTLADLTDGFANTAMGTGTLGSLKNGFNNTAMGVGALVELQLGFFNTAIGFGALSNSTGGSRNIAVGSDAGSEITNASNTICIGSAGANVSNACFIGNTFGAGTPAGVPVLISDKGRLGTLISSKRFKEDIQAMDKASEALFSLKPVSFRYKKEIDPAGTPQLGLVAEDVEKVNPDLIVRDKEGKPYSVRYEQVNAMLLNEFLKEHKSVEQQQASITDLKSTVAQQQKQIEALTAGLQKVSAQVELSKPAPQTVLNNH